MSFINRNTVNWKALLYVTLVITLFVAVACGTSSPVEPTTAPTAPAAQATAVPTTTPSEAMEPEDVMVNPGKVTIMNAVWGNEIFDPRDQVGEGLNFFRPLHSFWINGNKDLELIPGVASEWEISPDGFSWSFTVREGVMFHNGEEMTAEDGLFTWQYIYGPEAVEKSLSPGQSNQARLTDTVEAAGNVVKITHKQVLANFAFISSAAAIGTTGAIMPKKYFEEVGNDAYNLEPVGAGPFKLEKYRRSEQMLFERFDDYYYTEANGFPEDRSVNFQTLDLRLVPEASTRVAALRAGDADIVEANITVKKQIENSGGRIIFGREATYVWMILQGCHIETFPCNKSDVRFALDLAIDKEEIMYGLYTKEGGCVCGYNYVTPSALGYSPELDPFPFDPERARELLASAGYPNGEGFGTLKLYTWVAGDLPFLPELAQLVADQWTQNLGIETEVEVGETATIRNRWFNKELYGGVLFRPNEAKYDAGRSIGIYYADFDNRIHFGGLRVDLKQIVEEGRAETDPAKRQDAYNRMFLAVKEAHYEPSIGHVHLPWGVAPRIATWDPWPVTPYNSALWTITLK